MCNFTSHGICINFDNQEQPYPLEETTIVFLDPPKKFM